MQWGTTITYQLDSQKQPSTGLTGKRCGSHSHTEESSADSKTVQHSSNSQSRGPIAGILSNLKMQQAIAITHKLKIQEETSSAEFEKQEGTAVTPNWRSKNRCDKQTWNTACYSSYSHTEDSRWGIISRIETQERHSSHLQTGDSRTGIINRLKTQQATQQPLTFWRFKNRCDQQTQNTISYSSHSHTEDSRRGIISKIEIQA